MKTMTCKQLYGPCDALIHGEPSQEMMENSKKHAMEMIAKGDKPQSCYRKRKLAISRCGFESNRPSKKHYFLLDAEFNK